MTSEIRYSIIIVTFNRPGALSRCLEAVYRQTCERRDVELLVANDGGIEKLHKDCLSVKEGYSIQCFNLEHRGPAFARNYCISRSKGDIVVFLDDDSEPETVWFSALDAAWRSHPEYAGIGGCIVSASNDSIASRVNGDLFNWYIRQSFITPAPAFISTCNASYRKETLERIGGFDSSFLTASGEDRDLCIRLGAAGGRLMLEEKALVYHDRKLKIAHFAKRHFKYGRSAKRLYEMHPNLKPLEARSYVAFYRSILQKHSAMCDKAEALFLITLSQLATAAGYFFGCVKGGEGRPCASINSLQMPLTNRLDANLGYVCNNNCIFCYFKNRRKEAVSPSTGCARILLKRIRQMGIDTLEMTGGEVTIRDDILDLIRYAKHELRFRKISIITNGSVFCDEAFARKAVNLGVDDVLVSIHGHDSLLHDRLVGRPGSFDEALKAIQNIQNSGASCRTNTVITELNYQDVSRIAETLNRAGIREVNFIFFSPLDDALEAERHLWPVYSKAAPHIKQMIDSYKDKFTSISVKVIPFCFLEGYEEHVTDLFQNIYDPYEWDFYRRVAIRRNPFVSAASGIAGLLLFVGVRRALKIGFRKALYEGIVRIQAFRECTKSHVCRRCRYDLICPGIWKAYAARIGLDELKAVHGEKVIDIDIFLRKRYMKGCK